MFYNCGPNFYVQFGCMILHIFYSVDIWKVVRPKQNIDVLIF